MSADGPDSPVPDRRPSSSGGDQSDRPAPRNRPAPHRAQPSALELVRWSAILLGISLLVAALAIPLLNWLGFGS